MMLNNMEINQYFDNISTDKQDKHRLIQQVNNILNRESMIFVLHGSYCTGKSTLMRILEKTIHFTTIPTQMFHGRFRNIMRDPDYLILNLDDDVLDANTISNLKLLVHGEYSCNTTGEVFSKKTIIITTGRNIFVDDPGFLARCEFIPMNQIIQNRDHSIEDRISGQDFVTYLESYLEGYDKFKTACLCWGDIVKYRRIAIHKDVFPTITRKIEESVYDPCWYKP